MGHQYHCNKGHTRKSELKKQVPANCTLQAIVDTIIPETINSNWRKCTVVDQSKSFGIRQLEKVSTSQIISFLIHKMDIDKWDNMSKNTLCRPDTLESA